MLEPPGSIFKCTNPVCQGAFTVIAYSFDDPACKVIGNAHIVPLTGNTPYYCPACGKNLGRAEQ